MKHRRFPTPIVEKAPLNTADRIGRTIPVASAGVAGLCIVLLVMWLLPSTRPQPVDVSKDGSWQVGMLRPDGLRLVVAGRSDATHVVDPDRFVEPDIKHSYWVARQIPALLNKLYCWCGCENRGEHRSNLECFEDQMAVDCLACRGTAEMAYEMSQKGITDAAKIQAAVDRVWGPK